MARSAASSSRRPADAHFRPAATCAISTRLGRTGRQRGSARLLARGIRPQRRDQALSQALRGADRRHRHGRRRRGLGARLAPGRRRPISSSPCRRSASASFPMSARPGSCRACRVRSAPIARSPATGSDADGRRRGRRRDPPRRLGAVFGDLADALCGAGGRSMRHCLGSRLPTASATRPQRRGGDGPVMAHRAAIDRIFAPDRVEAILARLDAEAASGRRRCRSGRAPRRGDDPRQGAAQPEDRARADAARPRLVVRGMHGGGVPHRFAGRLWRGFL